jgi:hypothetical protein
VLCACFFGSQINAPSKYGVFKRKENREIEFNDCIRVNKVVERRGEQSRRAGTRLNLCGSGFEYKIVKLAGGSETMERLTN